MGDLYPVAVGLPGLRTMADDAIGQFCTHLCLHLRFAGSLFLGIEGGRCRCPGNTGPGFGAACRHGGAVQRGHDRTAVPAAREHHRRADVRFEPATREGVSAKGPNGNGTAAAPSPSGGAGQSAYRCIDAHQSGASAGNRRAETGGQRPA